MSSYHQSPPTPILTHTPPSSTTPLNLGPLTIRILSTTPHTTVTHLTLPPYTRGLPLLANRLHSVTYYIISGSLSFSYNPNTHQTPNLNPTPSSSSSPPAPVPSQSPSTPQLQLQTFTAAKSHTITIPSGCIHSFGNGDAEPAQVLCIYAPGNWVGALRELSGRAREDWSGVLRGWGCEVFENTRGDESGEEENDDEAEDEELTHVPARLRCMAG